MIDTYIIGDITDREAKTFGMFTKIGRAHV